MGLPEQILEEQILEMLRQGQLGGVKIQRANDLEHKRNVREKNRRAAKAARRSRKRNR